MIVLALFVSSLLQAYEAAPVGSADAGKTAWAARRCMRCHGDAGQGGFGPDLAGRTLTYNQFRRAMRQPWGVMPTFIEQYTNDQAIADLQAYISTFPKVDEPAPWMLDIKNILATSTWTAKPPSADAPYGQRLFANYGCIECHGPEGLTIRQDYAGEASDNDFDHFAKDIYNHTDRYKSPRMGDFSRMRLPESALREIYHFLFEQLGYLAPLNGTVSAGSSSGESTTYTLQLENRGIPGKGITPKNLTIALALAPGTTVTSATGEGYKGVSSDADLKSQAAIWQLPSIGPKEKQTYTVTVAGSGRKPAEVFKGSVVRWTEPEVRKALPNLELRDPQSAGKNPQIAIAFR
jgi:mono/diheme cytochrome c family protein